MAEKIDILSSKYFIDGLEKVESEELSELLKNPEYKERFEWFRKNWENDLADTGCKFDMSSGRSCIKPNMISSSSSYRYSAIGIRGKSQPLSNHHPLAALLPISLPLLLG